MWLVTRIGFFSVVQKKGDANLTVRARVADDLDRLRAEYLPSLSSTQATPGNDYPYRAHVGHEEFAKALAQLARDVHYDNFKSEVGKSQGTKREGVYHKVWADLLALQDLPAKAPKPVAAPKKASGSPARKQAGPVANAFGIVLVDPEGRVLLREPANHANGYVWTFAKGKGKPGEAPETIARREVLEETGYEADIDGELPEAFRGQSGATRFFVSRKFRQVGEHDWETASIRWASLEEARELVAQSTDATARRRDAEVLDALEAFLKARK